MVAQTGLQVGSLILVNNVVLCQLVQHLLYFGIQSIGLLLVGHGTQFTNSVAHGLCIVVVVLSLFLVLTNSLQG